ncbi:LuxR C-terminal-related transcriptional regulator [Microbacterium kunmingense]|uniref:LuxR C-terminal-related transcriptional regulator n=1 Tax=Microbacterium kunmingense TaxID=2915939 RepID=UPI003D73F719
MSRCTWWLGAPEDAIDALERAYAIEDADAATRIRCALTIALLRMIRGELTVGTAWSRRAARALEAVPPQAEHAYLIYLEASMALDGAELPWSDECVARIGALVDQTSDPCAEALAAIVEGMAALREGRISEGFARLDEGMLRVLAGDVDPEWAADILCTVIHGCHELADYQRMADWTRAAEEWSRRHGSDGVLVGVCRVHRLELRCVRGEWDAAEEALSSLCTDLTPVNIWVAGAGWYQLGELRRLRGDADGAREAYAQARSAGIEPLPGEPLIAFAEGDEGRAWNLLVDGLHARDRLGRVRLLRPAVEVAVATGRREEAISLMRELEVAAIDFGTPGLQAWAHHARGMIALSERRTDDARADFVAADSLFRRLGLRWERARLRAWRAAAYEVDGDVDAADHCRAEAEATFLDLGAVPALKVSLPADDPATAGPLTAREHEILGLVADGASNRDVAAELFISEKTVGRHLANIYVKLGVGSRTAAAAWLHAERATRR